MKSDYQFKLHVFIFGILLSYTYCSPYNFAWYVFADAEPWVFMYTEPFVQSAGFIFAAILLTTVPFTRFNYKLLFLVYILLNVVFTLITEISFLIQS